MKTSLNVNWILTCWAASIEVEPLLAHLHPGDALSRQVRVDRGELATDGEVVDDLLYCLPQILVAVNTLV